ncbi:MAG: dephospho-CoA kinase [Pseudohongiella sp.]|nr:dephospho-CoA kinase [Pseudohongiella sp.]MDO9520895.1 dephospho-CoA kinase [Pseudohongiella sp.]MDP2128042.1 dephospho-CoA kinase [Pseudohongiella sp.]
MTKTKAAVVGITGGIGSGKTAATDRFASHGIDVIDADLMSREVVKPGKPALTAIAEKFGADQILLADGSLNRRALRDIIFTDNNKKLWLESLLHPLIRDEIIQRLRASKPPYCLLVSPLLLETDQHKLCERVLLIDAPESLQLSRTQQRDQTSETAVKAIMTNQLSREKRLAAADDIIINDSDLAALYAAVDLQHQKYLEQFS